MNEKQIQLARKMLARKRYRTFEVRAGHLDDDDKDKDKTGRMRFVASSNEPVETFVMTEDFMGRAFEVLSHKEEDVDLKRLRKSGHLLLDHQTSGMDANLGRIMKADVDGKRLTVDVKFNDENPVAERIEKEMKSGMRPNVSIGFRRDDSSAKMVREKDGIPVFEFGFEPFEVSSVLVPADITVGAGRSEKELLYRELGLDIDNETHSELAEELLREMKERPFAGSLEAEAEQKNLHIEGDDKQTIPLLMIDNNDGVKTRSAGNELEADSNTSIEEQRMSTENNKESAPAVTVGANMDVERKRSDAIFTMGREDNQLDLAIKANHEGWTVEKYMLEARILSKTDRKVDIVDQPNIDENQQKDLDVRKALRAYIESEDSSEVDELGREVAKAHGISTRKNALYIPLNIPLLRRTDFPNLSKRAHATSPSADGGALVGTEFLAIAPSLFEDSVAAKIGVRFITAQNLLQVPRFDSNMPVTWVAEESAISLDSGSFTTVTLAPNQLVAAVPITTFLGSAVDGAYSPADAILDNIVAGLAEGVEAAIFQGGGGAEPTGLLNDTGITAVTSGSNADLELYGRLWQAVRDNSARGTGPFVVGADVYRAGVENPALTGGTDRPTITTDPSGQFSGLTDYGRVTDSQHLPAISALYGTFNNVLAATFGVMEIRRDESVRLLNGEDVLFGRIFFDTVATQPGQLSKASASVDLTP